MSPKPIMRSLIDFFLKEIIIFPHYLLWCHSRSIAAYRYESHLIMSSFHTPHLHIHHRMRKLAGQPDTSEHHIGLLMHEFPDRMLSCIPVRSLIGRIYVQHPHILLFQRVAKDIVRFHLTFCPDLLKRRNPVSLEHFVGNVAAEFLINDIDLLLAYLHSSSRSCPVTKKASEKLPISAMST